MKLVRAAWNGHGGDAFLVSGETTMESRLQAPPVRPDGLQLEEKRGFQQRFWMLERLAWVLFAALVASAMAGLAGGGGYFSRQSVAIGNAVADLPRITRAQGSDNITLLLHGAEASRSIVLGDDFTRYFLIEHMQPAPERSLMVSSGLELVFAGSTEGPIRVLLDIRPLRPGFASFDLAVGDQRTAAEILVLP
jgi:hypothetical protein